MHMVLQHSPNREKILKKREKLETLYPSVTKISSNIKMNTLITGTELRVHISSTILSTNL
jgi:hypothetical protein